MDTDHGPIRGLDPRRSERPSRSSGPGASTRSADLTAEHESPLETPAHRRLIEAPTRLCSVQ